MPFKTGKDYVRPGIPDRGAATIVELFHARGHLDELGRPVPNPAPGTPTGDPVQARLNHGRWIGDCGLPDLARGRTCLNAQLLDPDDPRFFCVECHNLAVGGRWRPVAWPADQAGIEAELEGLPEAEQNWQPPLPGKQGRGLGELHPHGSDPPEQGGSS